MDESILLQFQIGGSPMKVVSFAADKGIAFDSPKDASPLNIAFGIKPLLPGRLDPVRLRHDWRDKEFGLDVTAQAGGLLLSGFRGDREGLPFGAYDLTVEVESFTFRNGEPRIVIGEGQQVAVTVDAVPEKRKVKLKDNFDDATTKLVRKSTVDDIDLMTWLASSTPREARKACLLNILTKLAAPPMKGVRAGLTPRIRSIHFAEVDRVYAAADPVLKDDVEGFVKKKGWVAEGPPKDAIHEKMVTDALARFPELAGKELKDSTLASFRQGGRNSMQIVIASPNFTHPRVYTDLDIDLGNPLWDLEGLFVHLGEVLDSGKTDHFALHDKLNRNETEDFVFYDIV